MAGPEGLAPAATRVHHREDRIRSHIQLRWLGLLLVRVAENATSDTWRNLRNELDRMHLVTLRHGRPHRQALGNDQAPAGHPRHPRGARASPDPRLRVPHGRRVVPAHKLA